MRLVILFALLIIGGCKPSIESETKVFIHDNEDAICKFVNLMDSLGIVKSKIVFTQSILETRWWTSTIFKENKNMFGQKVDITCYATKKYRGHAYYKTYVESILAYKCWQDRRLSDYGQPIVTDEDYYRFLECLRFPAYPGKCLRYAEDPKYVSKLKIIHKTIFNGRSCDSSARTRVDASRMEPAQRAIDAVKRRSAIHSTDNQDSRGE